jgi:membrane-associated phospholipid phosphatase
MRAWLLKQVLDSTSTVSAVQRLFGVLPGLGPSSSLVAGVFHVGAALGNEITFILFLPALFWEFDCAVARHIILLWCFSYYVVHVVKDTLQLPRPPAFQACKEHEKVIQAWKQKEGGKDIAGYKKVVVPQLDSCTSCKQGTVKLERLYEHEYGFPSSHTHNSFSMPLILLISSWERYAPGQNKLWLALAMLTWVVLCPLSRLVLGVHSIPDVIGGALFGLAGLGLALAFLPQLDALILNTPTTVFAPIAICLMLLAIVAYPRPVKPAWVPTPGDTTIILAVTCGVTIAANILRDSHKAKLHDPIVLPWNAASSTGANTGNGLLFTVLAMVGRLLLGFVILFATRAGLKALCMAVLPKIFPVVYADADDASVQEDAPPISPSPGAAKLKPSSSGFGLDEDNDPKEQAKSNNSTNNSGGGLRNRGKGGNADVAPESRSSRSDPRDVEPSPRADHATAGSSSNTVIAAESNKKQQIRVPDKKNYWVELGTKAVVYTAIGLNAVLTIPWLYQRWGWKDYKIAQGGPQL